MQKLNDIVIVTATYTDRNGETKRKYKNIGQEMEKDGKRFLLLDPGVNLAAYRQEGKESVLASLYPPKDKPAKQPPADYAQADEFGDDIPFN